MKLDDFTHGSMLYGTIGVGAALVLLVMCCCCCRSRSSKKEDHARCLTPNQIAPDSKHHYALDVVLTSPATLPAQPAQLLPRKSLGGTEIDYSAMTSPVQAPSPDQERRSSMGRRDFERLSTSRFSFSKPDKTSDETDRASTASYSPPSRKNSTVNESDRLSTASNSPPRISSTAKESDRPKPLIVSVTAPLQTPGLELGDFEMMPTSPIQPASHRQRKKNSELTLAIPTSPVLHHSSVGANAGLSPTDMEWYTAMATSPINAPSQEIELDEATPPAAPAAPVPLPMTPKRKKSVTFEVPDDEKDLAKRPATPRSILTTSSRWTPAPADPFALAEDPVVVASRLPFETVKTGELLSQDGFGEIYKGTYRDSVVTIKRLAPEARRDATKIQALFREVQLLAVMDHAHIVTFVGVAWDAFRDVCVVSEYMEGGDLRSALNHSNQLGRPLGFDKQKATIARHVAHALAYLHSLQKTVLYRDIKSTNVLLDKEHMVAKLANCSGLKEWQDGTMTVGVGSGLWMAPEVMTGSQYDEKADVFSFGILLSELDTYLLPYADFTTADSGDIDSQLALTTTPVLLQRILAGKATVTFSSDLRVDVRALGEACVRLDPKQRPTSAQVLYELQKIERTMESEISIVL